MTKNHFKLCMKIKVTKTVDGMSLALRRQTVDLGRLLWFPGLDVVLHLSSLSENLPMPSPHPTLQSRRVAIHFDILCLPVPPTGIPEEKRKGLL